jgi:thiamine biosynthesis lipoprotein ApbE
VDPVTRRLSESCWEQVTASGAKCLDADVAAKTGFLLGERGPTWLDARRIPGRFVGLDGEIVENDAWQSATRTAAACT